MKAQLALLVLLFPFLSFGQTGVISGVIKDKITGETIVGANVIIKNTLIGCSSDLDGYFKLTNLEAGTYTLVVSFISYQNIEQSGVIVEKNKTTSVNFLLSESATELHDVEVYAKKKVDTDVSMVSSVRNSTLVISGVSRQQIERSPDKDAAEVVRRIPGITIMDDRFIIVRGLDKRYNNVWLNGTTTPSSESDAKAFSFNSVPSSLISRLTVFKTAAPELPGDFAGANVLIETKNVPEEDFTSIGFNVGYNPEVSFSKFISYEGGSLDWLGFDDGTRSLPENWPSTETYEEVRGNINEEGWAKITEWSKSFNAIWNLDENRTALPDFSGSIILARNYTLNGTPKKLGIITSISYSRSSDIENSFKARYESYDTIQDEPDTMQYSHDATYLEKVNLGVMNNWHYEINKRNQLEIKTVYNRISKNQTIIRNGYDYYQENRFYAHELNFEGRNTLSTQLGGKHQILDNQLSIDWIIGYSYADKNQPDTRRVKLNQNMNEEDIHYLDYYLVLNNQATPSINGRLFSEMKENINNGLMNINYNLKIGHYTQQIKAGFFIENKARFFSIRNIGIVKSGNDYELPYLPLDSVFQDEYIGYLNGILYAENTQSKDSYKAYNHMQAGYLSTNIPLTSLISIYGGVRIEHNKQQLTGFQDIASGDETPDIYIDTINILPSVNITYNLSEKSIARLAYGKTINRPEFRELSPFAYYDFERTATIYGNDTLKNAYIDNIDLRYEFYPSPSELITLGAFYKYFNSPIELNLFPASNGWDFVAKNIDKGISTGLELDIKKSFLSLSERNSSFNVLKDFTLLFNAAWIYSRVYGSDAYLRDKIRPMQGQSPYIINTGLYYQNEKTGILVSALYNVIGKRIVYVGTSDTPHTYELPHNQVDITITKEFPNRLKLKLTIKDLLNQEIKYIQTQSYFKDTDGDQIGDTTVYREQLVNALRPGRLFNLSVSYTF